MFLSLIYQPTPVATTAVSNAIAATDNAPAVNTVATPAIISRKERWNCIQKIRWNCIQKIDIIH